MANKGAKGCDRPELYDDQDSQPVQEGSGVAMIGELPDCMREAIERREALPPTECAES
jgi:hypothetical protein